MDRQQPPRAQPKPSFRLNENERAALAVLADSVGQAALARVCDELMASLKEDVLKTEISKPEDEHVLVQRKLRLEGAAKFARELQSFLSFLKRSDMDV